MSLEITQNGARHIDPGLQTLPPLSMIDPSRFDIGAPGFFSLADGTDLRSVDPFGRLKKQRGLGYAWDVRARWLYKKYKNHPWVHWEARRLSDGALMGKSDYSDRGIWGASIPKALVVATLLNRYDGKLTPVLWKGVIELLANSDNRYWEPLERAAGGEDALDEFSRSMGYPRLRPSRRLNWVNAHDLSRFMQDIYRGRFPGAEALFKVLAACRTGATKSRKYLPRHVHVAGKTGTSKRYRHDMRFILVEGHWYSVVVLSRLGDNEPVSLLFGGLYRNSLLPDARRHRVL